MTLYPLGGTEVYLDGAVRCRETLMRDNPSPFAVSNARTIGRASRGAGRLTRCGYGYLESA